MSDNGCIYKDSGAFESGEGICYVGEFGPEDCIEFDHIKGTGMFSDFQYEAVEAGMTPKEYAESKDLKPMNVK